MTTAPQAAALLATVTIVATAARRIPRPVRIRAATGEVANPPHRLASRTGRPWPSVRFGRSRRSDASPAVVAAWVDDLAHAVRSGSTLRAAVTNVVPADPRLARRTSAARIALGRGSALAAALSGWSTGGDRHLAAAGTVVSAIAAAGGDAAAPLDRLGAAMRNHAADDLERAANSAQARLSAQVLTFVPLAVLTVLAASDPGVRGVVASSTGAVLVGAGLFLNAAGAWWMRRIIDEAR